MARSVGWSFAGNHQAELCGSSMPSAPNAPCFQVLMPPAVSVDGVSEYATTTVAVWPLSSGWAGVITSSPSPLLFWNWAGRLFTSTLDALSAKSRSNRERSCVAVSSSVVWPDSRSVAGW